MGAAREERELAAYRLRKAAKWSYVWLDDKTLRELIDMEPSGLSLDSTIGEYMDSASEVFMRLADLIDPEGDEDVTRKVVLLRKAESGKVYCSRCGRELKRDYMYSLSWNFCPRCGAEILR